MPVKSPVDLKEVTLLYTVLVNGKQIKDYYPVLSIEISHEINKVSYAEITLTDGDGESGTFPISDSNDLAPGNEIEITAGYEGANEEPVFRGIIVKQGLQLDADGYRLSVTCKHKAVNMTFSRTEESFKDKTDSAIMQNLLSKYGLDGSVESTAGNQEVMVQKLTTDWDLLLCRAGFCGYIILLDGEAVKIGKPQLGGEAVLRVAFGDSIITFQAEINAEKQAGSLSASAWDIKNQDLLTASGTEPSLNAQGNLDARTLAGKLPTPQVLALHAGTPMTAEDLKTWADGCLLRMRMSGLKGSVSFQGNASVKTGSLIGLEGVGDRYNGKAFVSAVRHTLNNGGWTTQVKFGLDQPREYESQRFTYAAANGQIPAIHGLQVATVQTLHDDPAGQHRVLVRVPSNAQSTDGLWARMSNFYATSGTGVGFLPEPGDEVVVGFFESDPRYPVILGSLYSNARVPLNTPADNNNYIKTLTTKSLLKISFDDEKKIITIGTPGGNSITLNDTDKIIELKDQNNNTVKLNPDGISMKSAGNIQVEATGNISLQATGKLSLSAQADLTVAGLNINQTAQVGFTAKGNASAELSASGQTVVKGAIVMIN